MSVLPSVDKNWAPSKNLMEAILKVYQGSDKLDLTNVSAEEWKKAEAHTEFFENLYSNPCKENVVDLICEFNNLGINVDIESLCAFGNISFVISQNLYDFTKLTKSLRHIIDDKVLMNEAIVSHNACGPIDFQNLLDDINQRWFESWSKENSVAVGALLVDLCDYLGIKVEPISESLADWDVEEFEVECIAETSRESLRKFARLFSKPMNEWYPKNKTKMTKNMTTNTKTFSFEPAALKSNSVNEEGILIIPEIHKELNPLFVPKNKAVPFFQRCNEFSLSDYFDNDELDSIFSSSTNLVDIWKELRDAGVVEPEYYTWTVLDVNSNIILEISQINGYYDNILEVTEQSHAAFDIVIQTAFEQDVVLSKFLYEKYMELKRISKQELFQELKDLGDDGSYTEKVNNLVLPKGKSELMDRFSAYHNLEEIHDFLNKLNKSKKDEISSFEIVSQGNGQYFIHAKVTKRDWDDLMLESWFW